MMMMMSVVNQNSNHRVEEMCSTTLKTRLIEKFEAVEQVKAEIADVRYVSTTAAITSGRSKLEVTLVSLATGMIRLNSPDDQLYWRFIDSVVRTL